jgi:MFS family permease
LWGGWAASSLLGPGVPFYALAATAALAGAALAASGRDVARLTLPSTSAADAKPTTEESDPPPLLWRSRPALAVAAAVVAANASASVGEPLVPLWLDQGPLGLSPGLQGVVFSTATLSYTLATPVAGQLADDAKRRSWLLLAGLTGIAVGYALISVAPWAAGADGVAQAGWRSLPLLVGGLAVLGVGVAFIDTPCLPLLAAIFEEHAGQESNGDSHGSAAAIASAAMSFGLFLGPLVSAPLVAPFQHVDADASWLAQGLAPASWAAGAACVAVALVTYREYRKLAS